LKFTFIRDTFFNLSFKNAEDKSVQLTCKGKINW